jgi:hypothetical protein
MPTNATGRTLGDLEDSGDACGSSCNRQAGTFHKALLVNPSPIPHLFFMMKSSFLIRVCFAVPSLGLKNPYKAARNPEE